MKKTKRVSALLLSAAIMASVLPSAAAGAAATDVTLKGRYETNIPIKVEYTASGDVTVQWEISDNGADGWTAIDGATGDSYTPDQTKGLKWIRAAVTADGATVYSAPKQLKDRWYGKKTGPADGSTATLACDPNATITTIDITNIKEDPNNSSADAIFNIDGDDYILLDVTEDDDSHFLVMRRKAIGNHTISTGGQLMDDIMCWLNDKSSIDIYYNNNSQMTTKSGKADYALEGGYRADMESAEPQYYAISDKIMRHIDENAIWKQEPKQWEWGNREITYSGGLTIPSLTDYEIYSDKIGWKDFYDNGDPNINTYMAFRTGHGSGGDGHHTATYAAAEWPVGQTYGNDGTVNAYAIRPMFFLKDDFFLDPDIADQMDFDAIGEDVKYAIANSGTTEELTAAGYDAEELAPYEDKTGEISEITADGIYETSLPITLSVDYEGTMGRLVYSVYVSDSENGEYTLAASQRGNNAVPIPVTAGGKWVKFSVTTTDGIVKWTEPHYIEEGPWERDGGIHPENIGKEQNCSDGSTIVMRDLAVKNETTPADYIFNIDGMDFIMLDVTESNASKFFVMSKNIVSGEPVSFTTPGQLMDDMMNFLNSTNGVEGYMPNGDYLGRTDENGEYIDVIFPDAILEHINYNQVWKVERKMYDDQYERTVTGGISFPAMHEIREYSEKIGLWDDNAEWWTRTPLGPMTGGGDTTLYADDIHLGAFFAPVTRVEYSAHIRPVFYLDKSMFTDEVYDLSEFGIEVLAALRQAYTREELLAAGYSEEDLQQYYDVDGELLSAEINGIYETSLPVAAKFEYTGNNLDNIRINWYQADTADGDYSLIGSVSGSKNNFRLPYTAGGKYIKAEVTCIPTQTSYETEARYVQPEWGWQPAINNETPKAENGFIEFKDSDGVVQASFPDNSVFGRVPATTPAEYTFTYDGVEYILLDTTESDKSHYLVLTKTPTVKRAFNEKGNGQTFDDLIGWLNNLDSVTSYVDGNEVSTVTGYSTNGFLSGNPIPEAIRSHINRENNWKVERKMWDDEHERVYEGGIAIPSYKDFERYAEKIGVYDAGNFNTWLRTPDGKRFGGDGNVLLATGTANEFAGYFYGMNENSQNYIRPMFYLDKDFFTSVRVENIGSETAALIREDVPREDMVGSGLYSDAEIEEIYKVVTPPEEDYVRAEFTNVKEGGDVSAAITTNIPGDTQWAFVLAVYNGEGRLLGVNCGAEFVSLDENNLFEYDLTVSGIPAGDTNYAKVFVWDYRVSDMYPLYEAIVSE